MKSSGARRVSRIIRREKASRRIRRGRLSGNLPVNEKLMRDSVQEITIKSVEDVCP